MNLPWELPKTVKIGRRRYRMHTDFRDILEIISYLNDETLCAFIRWEIAVRLFYDRPVSRKFRPEARRLLAEFLSAGEQGGADTAYPSMDWSRDCRQILADVSAVAGSEIRQMPYVHWWTFLSWFFSIGEGQLSAVVGIREKLRRGITPEAWEMRLFCPYLTEDDPEQIRQLEALLESAKTTGA